MTAMNTSSDSSDSVPLEIDVRPMELDDLANIFHLGEKLFRSGKLPNAYRTWDEHEVVAFFQGDPDLCFVAETDEDEPRVVGFVLGTIIEKNRSAWTYGYLTWLGVDPMLKRSGIGNRLVNAFIHAAQKEGARMLLVDTDGDNTPAIRFFEQVGFTNPEKHVYLSLNLAKNGKTNGRTNGKGNGKVKSSA